MNTITDLADPRVAGFRGLPARSSEVSEVIVVESELAVRRLLASDARVQAVLAVDKRAAALSVPAHIPLYTCNQTLLEAIVGFPMHRGAIALAERPHRSIDALADALAAPGLVVCASGVSDPANLGSIARNCRAFGAAGLLIDPRGADLYARKAIRTSMGNVFAVASVVADPAASITALRARHPDLVVAAATVSEHARDLPGYHPPQRLVLVLGNEGAGVPADILQMADLELTIPMRQDTDSINVAAASAVLLYALTSRLRNRAS